MAERGGQTDWAIPPWELPGNCRLDCEPHRAPLVRFLGNASLVCALGSCVPLLCVPLFCLPGVPTTLAAALGAGLLGAGFGLAAGTLAAKDLAGMRAGYINPEGIWETRFGGRRGLRCMALGLCSSLLWGALLVAGYFP